MRDRLTESAVQVIARYQMLQPGQAVLVALSGGADSVALLLVLRELGYAVRALHLNHCLRGEESDRDENFVRALCARLDVPLAVRREDAAAYAAKLGESLETGARMLRYQILEEEAAACGCGCIATAHTADDNLETLIFHLARGTGGKGLSGIPPVRGNIVRPLIEVSRSGILSYLAERGQEYVTDSTNVCTDYARNHIRQKIIPVLRSLNPDCTGAGTRLSGLMRQDEDYLMQAAGRLMQNAQRENGYAAAVLAAAHPAASSRALRLMLEQAGAPMRSIGERQITLLDELCRMENPSAWLDLPGGICARRVYDLLLLEKKTTQKDISQQESALPVPFDGALWGGTLRLRTERLEKNCVINKTFNTFQVDCDTINFGTLSVRTRKAGDRLRLTASGGSKTLKRLMIDRKIPREIRDKLAVVTDCHGIIAVQNIGIDWSRRPQGGNLLEIEIEGEQV